MPSNPDDPRPDPSEDDHPTASKLRAWIDGDLSESELSALQRHVENCQQCAANAEQLRSAANRESPEPDGFQERLLAIARGGPTKGRTEDLVLVSEETINPAEKMGRRQADPSITETLRADTKSWHQACSSATDMTQTIKGESDKDELPSLELPIQQRSLSGGERPTATGKTDYDLLDVIGRGGMGVIYKARQSSMDRMVAIKMLKDVAETKNRRRMFLQEAVIAADLDHPNIVPVHELGSNADGALFYSMKRVEGTSWQEVIESNSEEENLNIWMRIADAVAFAHSRGFVHRDLKPENVMLGKFGEAWLMDWGLAFPTPDCSKPNVIRAPRLGGTPAYMAPEMAAAIDEISPATDIYLLGAILYQIVTGVPPHRGETVLTCMLAARKNEIVPSANRSGLLKIALRAMETLPKDRYESVVELQAAVRNWISHNDSVAIAENSSRLLEAAKREGNYQDFVRSIFGYEQAHSLFPENETFTESLSDAKLAYAQCAETNHDYDLAASLLDREIPDHCDVLHRVELAKKEQEARSTRLRLQQRAFRFMTVATLLLILGSVGVANWLRNSAIELANTNEPAMHASLSLESGLRRSLGALRGWVAIGDAEFKRDRAAAWKEEIEPSLKRLQQLTERSGNEQDRQNLSDLAQMLDDLFEAQWWIEDVAQTPGNEPATDLILRDLEPVEANIQSAMETLVHLEKDKWTAAESKPIWPALADMQLAFAKCHRRLVGFVETGHGVSRERHETWLKSVETSLDEMLAEESRLNQEQMELTNWLKDEFAAYRHLAARAIEYRNSDQSNLAQWRLKNQALPISREAQSALKKIVTRVRAATVENSQQINTVSLLAVSVGIAVAVGVLLVAWFMVFRTQISGHAATSRPINVAVILSIVLLTTEGLAQAQNPIGQDERDADAVDVVDTTQAVESADVFRQVMLIHRELELVRLEMGKPKYEMSDLPVSGVYPHEVYFQALTLDRKIDQLAFELIRTRKPPPNPPSGLITPAEVMRLVTSVTAQLKALKQELEISEDASPPPIDSSKTPTDVFRAIVQANRQLNLLVEKRFSPSDVFQQVTLAVGYCSELLALFPDATRLPDPPLFERRKTPADVARRLNVCLARVGRIAETSNVKMLKFGNPEREEASVQSSDVYDLAALLVSELAHLHSLHGDLRRPRRVFSPGPLFPSHVYQRAGMLESQVQQLERRVDENPDWLRAGE